MADSTANVESERLRRESMWQRLVSSGDPRSVQPRLLAEVGIRPHRTGHGIFRDKETTASLAADGVALSLLDTGTVYDDAFDAEGGLYYYPETRRDGSRDSGEIESLKNASKFGLPVFVILRGPSIETREVRRGWITAFDDLARASLIEFGEARPASLSATETAFTLRAPRRSSATIGLRTGRARFRFQVLRRYGPRCSFCPVSIPALLEATYLCPPEEGGADDPRNGLVMCRNHLKAFTANLLAIDPDSLRFVSREAGPSLLELGVPEEALSRVREVPHRDALAWRFRTWSEATEATARTAGATP